MLRSLFLFLRGFVGDLFARLLVGAGLGVVSYAAISAVLLASLALARSYAAAIGDAFGVVMLMGFGEAFSMIGSALLVRAAIASAGMSIGRRPASGGA